MKLIERKYTTITIFIAVIVVIGGYFTLPLITNLFFNADAVIYQKTRNSNDIQDRAYETFMRCSFPILGKKTIDDNYDSEFIKKIILNRNMQVSILPISNIENAVVNDVFLTETYNTNDSFQIAKIVYKINDNYYNINVAARYDTLYGILCRPSKVPTHKQVKSAVEYLQDLVDTNSNFFYPYFNLIEKAINQFRYTYVKESGYLYDNDYEEPSKYIIQDLLLNMKREKEKKEVDNNFFEVEHSFAECYEYGSKYVMTDGKNVMLLSTTGQYYIALFYDPISKRFCGIQHS